jgi:hypothetical protein
MQKTLVTFTAALVGAVMFGVASTAVGANATCTSPQGAITISGNLVAGNGCALTGTIVTGNVSVNSGGSLIADGATIGGNLEIAGTSGTNTICGTTIGGNLLVHNNTGPTTIGGGVCSDENTVGGNVDVHNNTGTEPITVANTAVKGNLDCHSDSPAAETGDGNFVDGKTKGECDTTVTVTIPCPADDGCTLNESSDDGFTSVTVTVPGGGKKGNLTLTFSAPPTDDGCLSEGGPVIGSLITVVPPGGYTAANPIIVDINYNIVEGPPITAVCKSKNGNPPFTALNLCTPTGSLSPTNVPCWEDLGFSEGGGYDVRAFMTSKDPAFTGH